MNYPSPKIVLSTIAMLIVAGFLFLNRTDDQDKAPEEPAEAKPTESVCIEGVKYWIYSTFRDRAILRAYKAQSKPELILCETERFKKSEKYGDEF